MADRVLALVHYYAREGYFRHVQTVCNEVLKKRPGDGVLTFWRAYGLLMEGNTADVRRLHGGRGPGLRMCGSLADARYSYRPCVTSPASRAILTLSWRSQPRNYWVTNPPRCPTTMPSLTSKPSWRCVAQRPAHGALQRDGGH